MVQIQTVTSGYRMEQALAAHVQFTETGAEDLATIEAVRGQIVFRETILPFTTPPAAIAEAVAENVNRSPVVIPGPPNLAGYTDMPASLREFLALFASTRPLREAAMKWKRNNDIKAKYALKGEGKQSVTTFENILCWSHLCLVVSHLDQLLWIARRVLTMAPVTDIPDTKLQSCTLLEVTPAL